MSTAKRLIAGSLASWFQIGITILAQLLLVPIYLSSWDVKTYGVWLAIQAFMMLVTSLDFGHQTFLGYEFLRLGKLNTKEIGLYMWSGVWVGLATGGLQILFILIVLATGFLKIILDDPSALNSSLVHDASLILIMQSVCWCLTISAGGIVSRVLNVFEYYPRLAWWNAFASGVSAIIPAIAVWLGADLLTAGIVLTISSFIFYTCFYIDVFRILHKVNVHYTKASFKLGYDNFLKSIILSVKNLLENIRIGGVRVVLAPLAGAAPLVAFSTIRTGANFAMQGLHTVTNPLMPELMRFLHHRDQDRSETALATIWVIIVAVMAPAVVVLQLCIEPLFNLWTRGKIPFDPTLFAILSLSVLVYAITQPATAIVSGNNLLKTQLIISTLAAVIVIGGMFIMVPKMGILGAGVALLIAEITAFIGYTQSAKKWLVTHGLAWPRYASVIAVRSVWIAGAAMAAIILFPHVKYGILVGSLCLMALNLYKYWQSLPAFARRRTEDVIGATPFLKKYASKP